MVHRLNKKRGSKDKTSQLNTLKQTTKQIIIKEDIIIKNALIPERIIWKDKSIFFIEFPSAKIANKVDN